MIAADSAKNGDSHYNLLLNHTGATDPLAGEDENIIVDDDEDSEESGSEGANSQEDEDKNLFNSDSSTNSSASNESATNINESQSQPKLSSGEQVAINAPSSGSNTESTSHDSVSKIIYSTLRTDDVDIKHLDEEEKLRIKKLKIDQEEAKKVSSSGVDTVSDVKSLVSQPDPPQMDANASIPESSSEVISIEKDSIKSLNQVEDPMDESSCVENQGTSEKVGGDQEKEEPMDQEWRICRDFRNKRHV